MKYRHLLTSVALTTCVLTALPALGADAAAPAAAASQKAEAPEVKVKLEDCPKAVQETFKREAAGATITEVDKETEDGKTTYEADVVIGGKNYEIKVAEDGTLISKKLDDGKEEGDKEQTGQHEDKK